MNSSSRPQDGSTGPTRRVVCTAAAVGVAGLVVGPLGSPARSMAAVATVPGAAAPTGPVGPESLSLDPSLLLDGEAVPPALTPPGPAKGPREVAGSADALAPFRQSSDTLVRDVDRQWWPYVLTSPAPLDRPVMDSTGVSMFRVGSVLYDHPVAQAQAALDQLESYQLNDDAAYLTRATLNAQRLIDRRVEFDGGWFYPYPFDFKLHGNSRDVIVAPWFSAMAQGQAMSTFVRLFELTGEARWRTAAARTFRTFQIGPSTTGRTPFVTWVDANDQLWLEEYAQQPLSRSDRTFNGHMFAMFGLWDYYRLTGDVEVLTTYRGAASTIRRYALDGLRAPQWRSHYCLTHPTIQDAKYHQIHVLELKYLHAQTGSSEFSRISDLLRDDHPPEPLALNAVVFQRGTHTGLRFTSAGEIIATKSLVLNGPSGAPATARQRIKGRGIHYLISAGGLAGYWVPETVGRSVMSGYQLRSGYPAVRDAVFPRGLRQSGYRVDATGRRTLVRSVGFTADSVAHFDTSSWVGGVPYVHIVDGAFADLMVPSSTLRLG